MTVTSADRYEGKEAVAMVDQVTAQLGATPEVVCADGAYGSGQNRAILEEHGVRLVSPPKPITFTKDGYFTVEDFHYDGVKDEFVCPAGRRLKYAYSDSIRPDRRCYGASEKVCRGCSLKSRCTRSAARKVKVSKDHAALIRLRADSRTESFQQLYRSRAPAVEGVFAEEKQWHGLRRAWRRALSKMRVQCLLIAAVPNFKRLAAAFMHFCGYSSAARPAIEAMWRFVSRLRFTMTILPSYTKSTARLA